MSKHQRRWRNDGGDLLTGYMIHTKEGKPRGPGGMVCWHTHGTYTAHAWTPEESWDNKASFKLRVAAKKAVERWLDQSTGRRKAAK